DTPGILARTVEDALAAAAAIDRRLGCAGEAIGEVTSLRIGVPDELFWDDCDRGIAEGVHDALAVAERKGHRLVRMSFPEAVHAFEVIKAGGTSGAELLAFLTRELPEWIGQLDPNTGIRMHAAADLTAVEWLGRKLTLDALARQTRRIFADVDVVATPTVALTAPVLAAIKTWDDYRPV